MKKFLCYDTNDAASGKINVGVNGVLKPNSTVPSSSGEPYKSLVTDGDGNTKWEDRLAYEDSKLVVDAGDGIQMVKVSDEVPSWASVDSPMKAWSSDGTHFITVSPEGYANLGNGSFVSGEFACFIATNNVEFSFSETTIVFPKKGVYFMSVSNKFTTGIASVDSDTPEITWDGNIGVIKKLDKKLIPSELNEIILPSSTSGSTKKFKITVNDSGTITATEV